MMAGRWAVGVDLGGTQVEVGRGARAGRGGASEAPPHAREVFGMVRGEKELMYRFTDSTRGISRP